MATDKTTTVKTDTTPKSKQNTTPFITATEAFDAFEESRKWYRVYHEPVNEFERIARNKPSDKIDPTLPRVTDGTMAAIVQEDPKRIIQQVPTGLLNCKQYPEYAKIADIVLRDELIPNYNRMGEMLQKSWNMVGKAKTYGMATSYTFLTSTNGKIHTDFVIPYIKDVFGEKGKAYVPDSNIRFLRSWYQKRDLKAIIEKERRLQEKDSSYKSDWDLKLLSDFMESGASSKTADTMTPAEREKGGDTGGYEVIHAFQAGVGAQLFSFSPRYEAGKTFRTKVNKDPRGVMPLDDLYCNVDLSNPIGRGSIELSGGIQNLIDQQMQMFQFMTTYQQAPALKVWGNVNKASLKIRPNSIWDMGTNPNNKVERDEISNQAIGNFSTNYGLLKSQIMNLNSSQDHSVSADSGNPAQSKTQAGVQAAESRLGVSDNYLRKQFETWFANQSETSVNIYFSEMTGKPTLQLEGGDLKDILKTPAKKFVDDKGLLTIPYKDINNVVFHFSVDASSSEIKEDTDNVEKLTEVYKLLQSDPDPSLADKKMKLLKILVNEIGAEGTDELFPEEEVGPDGQPMGQQQPQGPDPNMIMQMVQQAVQQAMEAQKQEPKDIAESIRWTPADLTPSERAQVLAKSGIQADPNGPDSSPNAQTMSMNATKTALDVSKTAHQHTMDIHNADQSIIQNQQQQDQQVITNQQTDQQAQQAQSSSSDTKSTSTSTPSEQPTQDHAMHPGEQQIAVQLLQRGFDENSVEQAIVMLRRGMPIEQVIQTLGAKQHATAS